MAKSCFPAADPRVLNSPRLAGSAFPIAHPDEYHLTLSADGYHDAEAFTPKVTEVEID